MSKIAISAPAADTPIPYLYNGGFTDFLFYDRADGYAEFSLKEPSQTTPMDPLQYPLAGYVCPRSALPGETISFYISSQIGAYTIDVYRQGASLIYMLSVPVAANAARPYGISRTAYRDGAQWPEVARVTVPQQWPSGLYLARVSGRRVSWKARDGNRAVSKSDCAGGRAIQRAPSARWRRWQPAEPSLGQSCQPRHSVRRAICRTGTPSHNPAWCSRHHV